jgi:hypothetical protein
LKTPFDAMSPTELRSLLVEAVGIIATLTAALVVIRDHGRLVGVDDPLADIAEEVLRLSRVGEFGALARGEELVRRALSEAGEPE